MTIFVFNINYTRTMTIGIITAMQSEYSYLNSLLDETIESQGRLFSYTKGMLGKNNIILMQSGIGKVNSALGAAELISLYSPDCIISSGVAGGIDSSLEVMDLVVSSRCCFHDVWCGEGNEMGQVQGLPLYFESNSELLSCATSLKPTNGSAIHSGTITSGDQFITDRAALATIKQTHPDALAVDMESTSIAQCCHLYQVPFISIRVISDTPATAENHTEQYENFWGEVAQRSFTTVELLLNNLPTTL